MHEFIDNDDGYTVWLKDHPSGFVLNVRRNPGASYAVLHRALCQTIAKPRDDGAYTGRGYRKVVANAVDDLRSYTRTLGGTNASFSLVCSKCDPLGG
ncbi:hypothetical protein [Qipengyuania sp.]|uniref:hypothetical protein n=1 Tax=Qipengyuania sp. TaxID=2004515 RepID=UPI0035C810B1